MSLADKTVAYAYLNALRHCIQYSKSNVDGSMLIPEASITNGDWFYKDAPFVQNGKASYLSPTVDAENGDTLCNNLVVAGAEMLGFSSPLKMYCSFITFRENGSSCETGSGGFAPFDEGRINDLKPKFLDVIKARGYEEATWPTTRSSTYDGYPGLYLIYKAAFDTGCSPKEATNPSPEFAYHVTVVNDDGTRTEKTYEGVKYDTTRYVYTGADLTEVNESCRTIEARVNEYATAYAKYRDKNQDEQTAPTSTDKDGSTGTGTAGSSSCNIDGVGWMICPILTFGANLADGAYGFLADNFLSVNTSILATDPNATTTNADGAVVKTGNGTYVAWGIMRTIANVAFVIVFLIIIFSQLSNVAVSNYGVKKMLPRLIFAAIFVNLSFFICQIAVDLANITGYGLKAVLAGVADQVTAAGGGAAVKAGDQSGHLLGIVTTVLTAGTLVYFNLGAIVLAVIAGLVVLLTVFILLFVRQALIVLLIVAAPLAFVAYLLPNTEPLFQKWRKIFTALLLLFPIIGLLYGACLLASAVLLQVAGDNVVMQIAAYIALVVPLIAIIPLLRGSLNAVPAIGNAIQKMGGKSSGLAQGGAKRTANAYKNSDWNKYRQGLKDERNARIRAGEYRGRGGKLNPRNWRSNANRAINNSDAYNWATQGFGTRRGKSAAKWEGKEITEKAETLAGRVDANGLPIDPRTLFDDALAEHQRVYNDPHASNAARRDARIGLAAAQAHLVRSNGQSGAEYARARLDTIRGGGAPIPSNPDPATPAPRTGPHDPHSGSATETPSSPAPSSDPYESRNAQRQEELAQQRADGEIPEMGEEFRVWHEEQARRENPAAASRGSTTDAQGRTTPQQARDDYHDGMAR